MPRYFFHLHNDIEAWDEEGQEMADLGAASDEALRCVRELMAEDVKGGKLTLSHWLEVQDEEGARLLALRFEDAVEIRAGDQG